VSVLAEIAGQSAATGSQPTVPFDPGAQLIAAGVTLVEPETFEVQVKGHIDLTTAITAVLPVGGIRLEHGLYKSRFSQAGNTFTLPTFTVQGIADRNWVGRTHRQYDGPDTGALNTVFHRIVANFAGTFRIGLGDAVFLAIQATWVGAGGVSFTPFLEYRLRRNVD
jgi:hypothetical protein